MAIEFEENSSTPQTTAHPNIQLQSEGSTIIKWLIANGAVKSNKQANYLVIGFCIVCLVAMIYIIAHYLFGFRINFYKSSQPSVLEIIKENRLKSRSQRNTY
jgi:hypothetical protein